MKIISLDAFVKNASERFETLNFLNSQALRNLKLTKIEAKSVLKFIVSKFLYIDLRFFKQLFVINMKNKLGFTVFEITISFRFSSPLSESNSFLFPPTYNGGGKS